MHQSSNKLWLGDHTLASLSSLPQGRQAGIMALRHLHTCAARLHCCTRSTSMAACAQSSRIRSVPQQLLRQNHHQGSANPCVPNTADSPVPYHSRRLNYKLQKQAPDGQQRKGTQVRPRNPRAWHVSSKLGMAGSEGPPWPVV